MSMLKTNCLKGFTPQITQNLRTNAQNQFKCLKKVETSAPVNFQKAEFSMVDVLMIGAFFLAFKGADKGLSYIKNCFSGKKTVKTTENLENKEILTRKVEEPKMDTPKDTVIAPLTENPEDKPVVFPNNKNEQNKMPVKVVGDTIILPYPYYYPTTICMSGNDIIYTNDFMYNS